jgi:hypothetical protein
LPASRFPHLAHWRSLPLVCRSAVTRYLGIMIAGHGFDGNVR